MYSLIQETIQKGINGEWSPKTFMEYRKNLPDFDRKKLDKALTGFGVLSALIAAGHFVETKGIEKFAMDANPISIDKLQSKIIPPAVRIFTN